MSAKLIEAVQKVRITQGKKGLLTLSKKTGLAPGTIRNVECGRIPRATNAYALAVACGLNEDEALEIAKDIDEGRDRGTTEKK